MTTQRNLKAQIRERMKRNGERYTTARAEILKDRAPSDGPWIGGQQSEVAAATNVLNRLGLSDPSGNPLTEAQVFGLSGGIGFLYGVFRYESGPTMTITTRNASMPDTFLDKLWDTPGLVASVSTTGGTKKAAGDLERALAKDAYPLVTVGSGAMPYLGLPLEDAAMMPIVVGVVGVDGDTLLIDDRSPQAHRVGGEGFARARSVVRSAKHRMVVVDPDSSIDWERALPAAIQNGAEGYNAPPVPQFAKNIGTAGLQKWHRLLTDPKDRMGWARVFPSGPEAGIGFARLYECIQHATTAPAAGRALHAEFLRFAAGLGTGPKALGDAAALLESSAGEWLAIAELARGVSPEVTRSCEAMDRRSELLDSGANPEKLRQAYEAQVGAIAGCSVGADVAGDVRTEIAAHVEKIMTLEAEAVALLGGKQEAPAPRPAAKGSAKSGDGNERVTMLNPNTGRSDSTIARSIYAPVRMAILEALDELPDLPLSQLSDQVEERTGPELWKKNKVGWYTMGVKLDIEARGLIERHSSPQRLRLTSAGRDALAYR